jgi:hypothetical protein
VNALWLKRAFDEEKRVIAPNGEYTSKAGFRLAFSFMCMLVLLVLFKPYQPSHLGIS